MSPSSSLSLFPMIPAPLPGLFQNPPPSLRLLSPTALPPTMVLFTWFEFKQSLLVGTGALRKEEYLGEIKTQGTGMRWGILKGREEREASLGTHKR